MNDFVLNLMLRGGGYKLQLSQRVQYEAMCTTPRRTLYMCVVVCHYGTIPQRGVCVCIVHSREGITVLFPLYCFFFKLLLFSRRRMRAELRVHTAEEKR